MANPNLWLTSVSPRWYFRSHRKSQRSLYLNFRSDRVFTSVSPRLLNYVCNGWILCGGYIYPSTPSSFVERAIRKNYHSYLTFLRRELPTLVLRSSHSIPTIWNLISSLPKLLSTQSFLPPQPYQWGELSVGEIIIWSTRARSSSSSTTSITFWRVVPPRLVRCRLGASVIEMWSWTKKFVRARRSPTSWRSTPSKASPPWA